MLYITNNCKPFSYWSLGFVVVDILYICNSYRYTGFSQQIPAIQTSFLFLSFFFTILALFCSFWGHLKRKYALKKEKEINYIYILKGNSLSFSIESIFRDDRCQYVKGRKVSDHQWLLCFQKSNGCLLAPFNKILRSWVYKPES